MLVKSTSINLFFELTNKQRKYLGLLPVGKDWEMVRLNDIYLYFDGDIIRKKICCSEFLYSEEELNEKTEANRSLLLPKTARGKRKKLNFTATHSFSPFGVHFSFSRYYLTIANNTTQTAYYSEVPIGNTGFVFLERWLNKWIAETTKKDLKEIEVFKDAQRKHCKFKEGDFFAFKIGRRKWGFGRILIDVAKRRKKDNLSANKNYGLTNLLGRPLIVKVYHRISDTPAIDTNELSEMSALPSQAILDDPFYYGEYPVIGYKPVKSEEYDMLISYSRSISIAEKNNVYLQYGFIYKEMDISEFDKYLLETNERYLNVNDVNPYRHESIRLTLYTTSLEACIAANSNKPYWKNKGKDADVKYDLRNPANRHIKTEIFNAFGLDAEKTYEENLRDYGADF